MDDYIAHLELIWHYFPYIFYTFVLLTFLPKSLRKIRQFAVADYEANRNKYHRCYGPELCCHNLIEHENAPAATKTAKPRKAVSRSYLRKQQSAQQLHVSETASSTHQHQQQPTGVPIKRQVPVSALPTNTNVNKIAKMFESGSGSMAHRKINRVLPEIRTTMLQRHINENDADADASLQAVKARLLHENIENSMNLLHQQTSNAAQTKLTDASDDLDEHWQTPPPSAMSSLQQRRRPNTLTYAGTSATPSTASPAASSPSPPNSPVLRAAPPVTLNLKTSVEDIFAAIARSAEKLEEENFIYAGCNTLSPVTSIDDILSQRRLSRPLSAYSISDLLNEEASFNKTFSNNKNQTNEQQQQQQQQQEETLLQLLQQQQQQKEEEEEEPQLNGQHQHQPEPQNVLKADESVFVENLLLSDSFSDLLKDEGVTSIDDILSQRRLSRPLSAYSLSDLLNEESSFNKTTYNNNDHTNEQEQQQQEPQQEQAPQLNGQHHPEPQIVLKEDESVFVENLLISDSYA